MRVLHLLDPAVPRRNDYSRRTLALLGELRAQGVNTVQLTAPEPGALHGGTARAPGRAPQPVASASIAANAIAGEPIAGEPIAGEPIADHPISGNPIHSGTTLHFYRTPAPWAACARVRGLGRLAALGLLAWRLRQLTRLTRPDLIHVHAPAGNALAALPVARLERLPLVVELERRSAAAGAASALETWALRRADALAAGSVEQRAHLQVAGLPGRRIAVIPPAPDLAPAGVPAPARRPAGLEGAPLVVYAGRLRREDGLELLLSVLPQLRRRFPGLRLLLAGGEPEPELAERLGAPGLRGHVAVTGKLARRRAAELLPRADIAVFPTLPGAHALLPARHLLNAMAQGCAVVASDIDCHRGLVVHGHNGILFGAGSGVALLNALVRLLAEPACLPVLGRAAAGFVARERNWEATAARYRRLYEAVLAEHRRRR